MSETEADLRALLEAATPGPWEVIRGGSVAAVMPRAGIYYTVARTFPTGNGPKHNAALIAALRNEAAALLDDRDRLRALEAGLRELLVGIENEALGGKRFPATVDIAEVWELLATRPDDAGVTEVGS